MIISYKTFTTTVHTILGVLSRDCKSEARQKYTPTVNDSEWFKVAVELADAAEEYMKNKHTKLLEPLENKLEDLNANILEVKQEIQKLNERYTADTLIFYVDGI
eukprot:GHVR01016834.1.p1 GENE.GHVR01016834.1~~GHVR01016834.1.p1  ORF type:complete len:104 (+),score=17.38 GHVR01016834.1:666-977(+)